VGSLPLGIGGDAVAPVSLDLAQTPAALIAGPPGAGRSSTLLALGQRLHAEGLAVVVVAARRSVLTTRAVQLGWPLCAPSSPSPGPLGCLLGEGDPRPVAALVDDAEQLGPGAVHDALEHHLAALDRGARRGALLVAGSPGELLVTYRGLVPSLRRARTGLLLHPVPAGGGDLLGIPTPRASPGPPGRATLVLQGRTSTLQLALPRPDGAPP
jgi:S-DNA-T family DNA segregation ATPase FtsK/SpoIIIE